MYDPATKEFFYNGKWYQDWNEVPEPDDLMYDIQHDESGSIELITSED